MSGDQIVHCAKRVTASFSPAWDSGGQEADDYVVEVTLQDTGGSVLDRKRALFRLGVSAGEIVDFSVTPTRFAVGEVVDISLAFRNTATVVINVQNEGKELIETFRHGVDDLPPEESVSFDDAWDTGGAQGGTYTISVYALYDGLSTEPLSAVVSTEPTGPRLYLALIKRGS